VLDAFCIFLKNTASGNTENVILFVKDGSTLMLASIHVCKEPNMCLKKAAHREPRSRSDLFRKT